MVVLPLYCQDDGSEGERKSEHSHITIMGDQKGCLGVIVALAV